MLILSMVKPQELCIFNYIEEPMKKMRLCERDARILLYELITNNLLTHDGKLYWWKGRRAREQEIPRTVN